ncbi:MAG: glycosyl hydrolase family 3, partial [Treponema sp.]|nr:glycosyl hydrolase family 3 [Treponema sp.]
MKDKVLAMTAAEKTGQRFTLGFTGKTPSPEFRRLVKEYKAGNVILFRDNLESASQARRLTGEIRNIVEGETGHPPFIALDQEGGVVTRLPRDMVNVPGAMALAAAGGRREVYEAARITAGELRRIGINLNLAPVLDVNSNPDNPAVGVRSFGTRPELAGALGTEVIRAFAEAGLLCCGKHFPGHGDTAVDSHLDLPRVDKDLAALETCELIPFKAAIAAGIPAIMTTHILFPRLEERSLPATMSRTIITGLLKEKLGFSGLVLSDGMEMKAIGDFYGVPEGCLAALGAGVDLVYICHESPQMEESLRAAAAAYNGGRFDREEFDRSVEKILLYKEKYASFGIDGGEEAGDFPERNAFLMRRTISLEGSAKAGSAILPPLGTRPFFTGPLAYRSTIASAKPDDALDFASWFARRFGGEGVQSSLNPGGEEIESICSRAAGHSSVVLGCYNAHLNRAQIDLAKALAGLHIPLIAAALRNPYDLKLMPPRAWKLAVWEYTENSFEALAGALRGDFIPTG